MPDLNDAKADTFTNSVWFNWPFDNILGKNTHDKPIGCPKKIVPFLFFF
jgi:hypothetical protein